ncbi:MAG: hypothetical protein Q4G46_09620 [Propionibacteriaceae bacterium]|nr:hypothetical protein [Propionibacteriaceae bacterium]
MSQTLEQFSDAYTRLLISSWSSSDYSERLEASPADVAREAGLEIAPEVQVTLVKPEGGEPGELADYYATFQEGLRNGRVELVVPGEPMIDMQQLTDEDLVEVAGGARACCCCPCSCCVEW